MSLDIRLMAVGETEVSGKNITHNLTDMWKALGIYDALYNSAGKTAKEVLPILEEGLQKMRKDPHEYKKYDSPNGWGLYENALPWLAELVADFAEYPDGVIDISK